MESDIAPPIAALSTDVPCIHCGYNLRGLTSGGHCPECGKAIDESLRGGLLRFANPDWLRKVRLGIKLQLWTIGLSIVMGIAAAFLAFRMGLGSNGFLVFQILPMIIGICGTLALTTREPREALQFEGVSVRTLLRIAAWLLPSFHVMNIAAELLPETLILVVTILGFFLWPLQYALFLLYVRRFALRIPDEQLYRSSTRLIIVGSAVYGLRGAISTFFIVQYVFERNTPTISPLPGDPPALFSVLSGIASVLAVGTLILFLWYVRLLTKYRKVLGAQLVLAEGVPT